MDQEMKKRFNSTFRAIQNQFDGVFKALFGGGRAELKLTDPQDLLNTGIDIVAQPPGKKVAKFKPPIGWRAVIDGYCTFILHLKDSSCAILYS